jgi:broad specificity phosphatase PhoE
MSAIYLIRHGQASFAAKEYDELSTLGEAQSRVLGESLVARKLQPDVIVCGRMRRHRQTAGACLQMMGLASQWDEDAGWDEYDHNDVLGGFDPKLRTQPGIAEALAGHKDLRQGFQEIFAKAVARWTEGAHDADYKESWPAFSARVEAGLTRLHARLERSQTALVFTSGGAISVAVRQLLGLPDQQAFQLNWTIANASITKVLSGAAGLRLSTLNEHGYLEGLLSDKGHKLITYR